MNLFKWGCLEWLALFLLIGIVIGTFEITTGIFYALLIAVLGYETSAAPDSLTGWSIVLAIIFWLALMMLYGWFSGRKIEKEKAHLLRSTPSTLSPADFERFVGLWLECQGYRGVEVVGHSGDYGADVLATDPNGRRVAIQCKRYRGSTGVKAIQEVYSACSYYACEQGAVFTTGHFTRQAKELAKKNGVKLYWWDRHTFVSER